MGRDVIPADLAWTEFPDGLAVRGVGVKAREVTARAARPAAAARPRRRGGRAVAPADPLAAALAATDMRVARTLELERRPPSARRRRGVEAPAAESADVELVVSAPPEGFGQVVLTIDEDNVATWHLPEPPAEAPPAARRRRGARAANTRLYKLSIGSEVAAKKTPRRRGLVATILKKVVQVLIFPITDAVLGPIEHLLAKQWEKKNAPYGVRTFAPDDFATRVDKALSADEWKALAAGPALLFVHGTFSTAHGAFSLLSAADVRAMHDAYEGRVFAFNHHTVSDSPQQNIEAFGQALPAGVSLELDIVCHSRGGLVSRTMACAADELIGAGRVKVRRIVFVASPNDGTALADRANMTKMLDRFTGVTRFLPDGPIEVAAELVVTAVKALASAGLKGLPGLAAQAPDSEFLKWLRSKDPGATEYYGVSADFEPSSPEWKKLVLETVEDAVMDGVFHDAKNDLVVPTMGVGETTHGPGFPIAPERYLRIDPGSDVIHTNMFGDRRIVDAIRSWLGAGGARRGLARRGRAATGGRSRRASLARAATRRAGGPAAAAPGAMRARREQAVEWKEASRAEAARSAKMIAEVERDRDERLRAFREARRAAVAPRRRGAGAAAAPVAILAEGDSWFSFPGFLGTGGGVIDHLQERLGSRAAILNMAHAGDAAQQMLSLEQRRRLETQLADPTLGFRILLFSGGGNDIIGDQFCLWLRPFENGMAAKDALDPARLGVALSLIEIAYRELLSIRDACNPRCWIVTHGYDYPTPRNKGVCHLGPWLLPALVYRGWSEPADQRLVAHRLIDGFNAMLTRLQAEWPSGTKRFVYIPTPSELDPDHDWHDEIHPSRDGFESIARRFHEEVEKILSSGD